MTILDDAKIRAVGLACAALLLPVGSVATAWADDPATDTKASDTTAVALPAPADPAPPAAHAPTPAPIDVPVPVTNAAPVPHLSSPNNLPPYTTSTPDGSQDPDQLSYLKDVWHAVQNHEISPKEALVFLAQRPMDADATPPDGMPAGPQVPVAGPPPPAAPQAPDVPPPPG
ncbi:hypothetical protein FZI85_04915 [Mycobacterium sp. CBMA293]|uniref:hypothetical protein n=1 Tax=unclassified Mycolicibacterium TaxID=2636767 RepID=UPI0012DF96AA|nr:MULTISPECIES: hypothetical protein [unclassified Mycolicibacterium]MUL48931.1 hypothetical protein [Mycolicibacterium sp. CBMA 360]MUL58655.1 hypothetical protein [Mycolicibacterium sp. CBMA 335]MUL74113.1 hypothetical protein [Mycolicibacterium sp. CBMA 311]MUL93538.1 hypothetical protein [Mycolicibacterium sp. CBMA 230]MUM04756.1 hypothetical protein [Mycolicibacterium sp. CBMA 213]